MDLPQTGQTSCYSGTGIINCAFTGQDGDILAGVAWPDPRFTDNGDGTLTDGLTGLTWLQNANCFGIRNFAEALSDADLLRHSTCGLTDGSAAGDWRLPNLNELASLLDAEDLSTAWLTSQGFLNVEPGDYVPSTTYASDPVQVWRVFFGSGVFRTYNKSTGGFYVLPVRGKSTAPAEVWSTGQTTMFESGDDGDLQFGAAWPTTRFTKNGDGTVTDDLTGLVWLEDANCFGARTWASALADANSLADGACGLSDGSEAGEWHLPNRVELRSLIDYSRSSPALPAGHPFQSVQNTVYWTSTSYGTSNAYYVAMSTGHMSTISKFNDPYRVWPVRSGGGTAPAVPDITVLDPVDPTTDLDLDFGDVLIGQSAQETITIRNDGTANLALDDIPTAQNPLGGNFAIAEDKCSQVVLIPGDSCTLAVAFGPGAAGAAIDSFDIPSNDTDENPTTMILRGTGVAAPEPNITVSPKPLDFGAVNDGSSFTLDLTITNAGTAELTIQAIGDPLAPFTVPDPTECVGPLAPSASCILHDVTFAPSAVGLFEDSFPITSDDPDEGTLTVNLTGTGVSASVPPQVIAVSPAAGTGQVAIQLGVVSATFDKAMAPTSIDDKPAAFTLEGPNGTVTGVAGTPAYDVVSKTARFEIAGDLEYETTYTATVTTLVTDTAGVALANDYVWTFTTRADPGTQQCAPEIGEEAGCVDFDAFTFGSGVALDTCSTNCTGPTTESAARKRVHQGVRNAADSVAEAEREMSGSARLDAAHFVLRAHSEDKASGAPGGTGVDVSGAAKVEVEGVAPGTLLPMRLEISRSIAGQGANYGIAMEARVYDFAYRDLVGVRTHLGPPSAQFENTFTSTFRVPDPFLFDPNNPDTWDLETVFSVDSPITLDFFYPVEANNGVYVYFTVYTFKGDQQSTVKGSYVARLSARPPAGATVRFSSGLAFTGTADADGDGVADSEDLTPNDAQTATPVAVTGTGAISVDTSANPGTTLADCRAISDDPASVNQTGKPTNLDFPDGLVSFTVEGVAQGGQAVVTLDFPTAFPTGAKYYKVDGDGFHEFAGAVINGKTVTLTLTDDGTNGDLVANDGRIEDPGGVAVPLVSGGGGASSSDDDKWWQGGCFIRALYP